VSDKPQPQPQAYREGGHLGGLRRFAVAITVFNLFGHLWLGFEQSWAQPLVSLATAYSLQLLLDTLDAWAHQRRPAFTRGVVPFIDNLLSAHISALAVAMLMYANDRLWVVSFGAAVAITSKYLFRAPVGNGKTRHFLNPSNFGIAVTLVLFHWVGIAAPYQYTEALDRIGDWMVPGIIICTGSLLNTFFTRRIPLILAWVGGFALQAIVRNAILGTPIVAGLSPMTGVAFILFTFYMVTDPATTPNARWPQVAFGASVAGVYSMLVALHVVYGLFFALVIVCLSRGLGLYILEYQRNMKTLPVAIPQTVPVGGAAS
jgi:hypothetical protein